MIIDLSSDQYGVRAWLEEHFPDIGPVRSAAIVSAFPPPGLWEIVEKTPSRLEEVEGIGPILAGQIAQTYELVKSTRELYVQLADYGLRSEYIRDAARRCPADRGRAVRPLQRAKGVHDLHRIDPVFGAPGGGAGIARSPRSPVWRRP